MVEKRAYDNTRRRQAAILRAAQRALENPPKEPKEREPRRERNPAKRRAAIPADRRCTTCGDITLASKSWVVGAALRRGLKPCCKACWSAMLREGTLPPILAEQETPAARALREAQGLPPPPPKVVEELEVVKLPGESKRKARQRMRAELRAEKRAKMAEVLRLASAEKEEAERAAVKPQLDRNSF